LLESELGICFLYFPLNPVLNYFWEGEWFPSLFLLHKRWVLLIRSNAAFESILTSVLLALNTSMLYLRWYLILFLTICFHVIQSPLKFLLWIPIPELKLMYGISEILGEITKWK
jgi:hypothetical protein